jgi:hypothetical protein
VFSSLIIVRKGGSLQELLHALLQEVVIAVSPMRATPTFHLVWSRGRDILGYPIVPSDSDALAPALHENVVPPLPLERTMCHFPDPETNTDFAKAVFPV